MAVSNCEQNRSLCAITKCFDHQGESRRLMAATRIVEVASGETRPVT